MAISCSEHYVQLVGSYEAALGPEITLQCWGVTLAQHRRRRQGDREKEEWPGRCGHTHWHRGARGKEGRLGNLVRKCDSLFSSSAFSVFKNTCHKTPTHVFLPPLSPFYSSTPTSFPFLFSNYLLSLHIHSSALLSNLHTYNYSMN